MADLSYKNLMGIIRSALESFEKQDDCAEAWGVSQGTVSKIKNGKDITFKTACGILERMKMVVLSENEIKAISQNDESSVRMRVSRDVSRATKLLGIDGERRMIIDDVINALQAPDDIKIESQNQRAAGE